MTERTETAPITLIGEELPIPARSTDLQAEVLALVKEVKAKPNNWYLVASFPEDPNKAHRRREAILKYAPDELEVTVQTPHVYAKYVVGEQAS